MWRKSARLAFVGMTRAKRELYLCRARMREFRGQTLYAVPSMFLDELPQEVELVDLSRHAGRSPAADRYRSGSNPAASSAWADAGIVPSSKPAEPGEYIVGQVVRHDTYGFGEVTDFSGYGALKKVRILFVSAGEKTFIADKVKLTVIPKKPQAPRSS